MPTVARPDSRTLHPAARIVVTIHRSAGTENRGEHLPKRPSSADPPVVPAGPVIDAGPALQQRSPPLIVGVGVAAGCEPALLSLLAAMPSRPGMAFIVAWQQRSGPCGVAADVLAQRSTLPVREVERRTAI